MSNNIPPARMKNEGVILCGHILIMPSCNSQNYQTLIFGLLTPLRCFLYVNVRVIVEVIKTGCCHVLIHPITYFGGGEAAILALLSFF